MCQWSYYTIQQLIPHNKSFHCGNQVTATRGSWKNVLRNVAVKLISLKIQASRCRCRGLSMNIAWQNKNLCWRAALFFAHMTCAQWTHRAHSVSVLEAPAEKKKGVSIRTSQDTPSYVWHTGTSDSLAGKNRPLKKGRACGSQVDGPKNYKATTLIPHEKKHAKV